MGELKFSVHSTNRNKLSLIGGLRRTPTLVRVLRRPCMGPFRRLGLTLRNF